MRVPARRAVSDIHHRIPHHHRHLGADARDSDQMVEALGIGLPRKAGVAANHPPEHAVRPNAVHDAARLPLRLVRQERERHAEVQGGDDVDQPRIGARVDEQAPVVDLEEAIEGAGIVRVTPAAASARCTSSRAPSPTIGRCRRSGSGGRRRWRASRLRCQQDRAANPRACRRDRTRRVCHCARQALRCGEHVIDRGQERLDLIGLGDESREARLARAAGLGGARVGGHGENGHRRLSASCRRLGSRRISS